MATQAFEVIAVGIPHTRREFIDAMLLPLTELPELSETDRQDVEEFHLDEETSRRHAEARRRAFEREKLQGQQLCSALQTILDEIGSNSRVKSAQRVGRPEGWFIRLDDDDLYMTLDMETVVRLLDGSATREEMDIFVSQVSGLVGAPARRSARG